MNDGYRNGRLGAVYGRLLVHTKAWLKNGFSSPGTKKIADTFKSIWLEFSTDAFSNKYVAELFIFHERACPAERHPRAHLRQYLRTAGRTSTGEQSSCTTLINTWNTRASWNMLLGTQFTREWTCFNQACDHIVSSRYSGSWTLDIVKSSYQYLYKSLYATCLLLLLVVFYVQRDRIV